MRTASKVQPEASLVGRTFPPVKTALLRLCIGCLLCPGPFIGRTSSAQTQEFASERWTARDGLPDSTILALAQTQDGVLWAGTFYGLVRFDGAQFTVFTRENLPGLHSEVINILATGPDSQLYVGTDRGVTVLSQGRARAFGKREGTDGSPVLVVLPVGADDAWIGTLSGALYHYHHETIEAIGSDALSREPVYGLAMSQDGTLWVGAGAGLFSLNHGALTRYQPKAPLPVVPIFDLALSPDGGLFAATNGGLFEIHEDHWRSWTTRSGLPSNALNILAMDTKGVLWIGTSKGTARLTNGMVQAISSVKCSTHTLLVDKEKSLWVGCDQGKGLQRLAAPRAVFLNVPQASDPAPVSSLVQDQRGAVWMASNRGLFRYQNHRFKQYTRRDGLPSNEIFSICLSSSGGLWIATDDGIAKFENGRIRSFRTKRAGLLDPFATVFEDKDRTLWVTTDRGLLRRRQGETIFEDVPEVKNSMWSMHQDREGALWVATSSHGLLRFAGKSITGFTKACGLASDTVYDTAEDDSGAIWASTAGGLSRIRNGKCATLGPRNGLPPGRPDSIIFDRHGHLWLRTRDGIVVIDLADADQVMDHGGWLRNSRFFGRDDGFGEVLSNSPIQRPMLLHSSGEIWIPTVAGIAMMNPSVLQEPVPRLSPQVTSLVTDSGERNLAMPVKVRPGDLHLQFSYSAPYLLGAKNLEYRYRLAGFDQDWRDAGTRREAVYTSLPAGKYHFQVSARLPFEPWSESSPAMELIVLPHIYQTWWWYTLLALLSATAIVLGYRVRLITVRRQYTVLMAERTRERSRLARELHDTLSQGMMAIHLQIQLARALLRSKPDEAGSHLDTAVTIVRNSASETRRSIAALRSDTDATMTLRDLLDKTVSRFTESSGIPLSASIEDDLPAVSDEVSHEIVRVAEEALANVRLHSGAEQAYLFARTSGDRLRVEVVDNGRGFEMSGGEFADPGHFGLTGMKERAQRIHGNLETMSAPGRGTTVVLEVPIDAQSKPGNSIFRSRSLGALTFLLLTSLMSQAQVGSGAPEASASVQRESKEQTKQAPSAAKYPKYSGQALDVDSAALGRVPPDALFRRDPLHAGMAPVGLFLNQLRKASHPLTFAATYTLINQYATATPASVRHNVATGRFDFVGSWRLYDHETNAGAISALVRSGTNIGVSEQFNQSNALGSALVLNCLPGGGAQDTITLNVLYYRQDFYRRKFAFYLGKIHPNEFISLSLYNNDERSQFLNGENDGNLTIPSDGIYAGGAALEYQVTPHLYVHTVTVDTEGGEQRNLKTLVDRKYMNAVELGWKSGAPSLQEHIFRFVVWRDDTATQGSGAGIGFGSDYELKSGWVPFGRLGAGTDHGNSIKRVFDAGLVNIRPFGRRGDMFGASINLTDPGRGAYHHEDLFESFYRVRMTSSIEFGPDLEVVVHPTNSPKEYSTALLGLRLKIII